MKSMCKRILLLGLWWLFVASVPATAECGRGDLVAIADLRAGAIPENQRVSIEGVVTGVFLGRERLGGFFLQDVGKPPAGLFVHAPHLDAEAVASGRRVQVEGRFIRFHGRPQVHRIATLRNCGVARLPEPVPLRLPDDAHRLPSLQDTRVRFEQVLTVTGNRDLHRYGTLQLAAEGRLWHPGEGRDDHGARNADRTILLDDGSYRVEPEPTPYLDPDGTRRSGDQVHNLTGILTRAFEADRVHPTDPVAFMAANPRPAPPPSDTDRLRVAALNLENHFLTLGQRGARNAAERERQRAKTLAVVQGLDADLLSLSEIENRQQAVDDLVAQLNRTLPAGKHYRAVPHPFPGDDAIRVALLYRPARLTLLDVTADRDAVHSRAPQLAWFQPREGGPDLGVVSVHFKAKSRCPESGDVDLGQGCWNRLRLAQAQRLVEWLASVRRDDAPVIIAGDINAYAAEEPAAWLRRMGKRDLGTPFLEPSRRYTYVFQGQAGTLDSLLGPDTLGPRVLDAGIWHVNADEPAFLGYAGDRPAPGPWRASDHDPVWIDLTLTQ
jgi:uncharacterized protein